MARLWREEGLRVPQRARKRRRVGDSAVAGDRLRAQRPGQVWALDFQHDRTADGRAIRLLNVVDEFTHEALQMRCERSISADETVATLEGLVAAHGAPQFVRCDNGTELTAHALTDWCRFAGVATSYIDPGAPWQNAFVESFHARVRDELLGVEEFSCLAEARVLIDDCARTTTTAARTPRWACRPQTRSPPPGTPRRHPRHDEHADGGSAALALRARYAPASIRPMT